MSTVLPRSVRSLAPLAVTLLAVIAVSRIPGLAPAGVLPLSTELAGWSILGALAALHHPFASRRAVGPNRTTPSHTVATLGLGTMVLAPVADRLGAVPAVWVATIAWLVAGIGRELIERRARRHHLAAEIEEGRRIEFDGLAPIMAATLAATAALVSEVAWVATVMAYLVVLLAVQIATAWWQNRPDDEERPVTGAVAARLIATVKPAILDAGGWIIGLALVTAAATAGWGSVGVAAAACALLAAEAARNALLRRASVHRAVKLERMQLAHARILGQASDMEEIARQILSECRRVLPVQWFQLEAMNEEAPAHAEPEDDAPKPPTSWAAGPDGMLFAGQPTPPERPKMIPGIHRRAEWRIFERELAAEDTTLAMVRLWCDPRRIKPGTEQLFASLVPQMTSSVHRARLEREATLDPLTQIPVRRKLETRLATAYSRSCEDGVSMAVIMCDLDFFKRINDTYGHAAGDRALIVVARILDSRRRESDFCCRYGGEEFALLLERAPGTAALQLAERLRLAVEALDLTYEGQSIPVTLSAGVAAFPEVHVKNAGELLLLADEALYEAKEQGRNQCLLNVGQGTYRAVDGSLIHVTDESPKAAPPRIFD